MLFGYWDGEDQDGRGSDLYELALTPVFRYQGSEFGTSAWSSFAELGVGVHLLSETRIADLDLSSNLQFGSLIGFGVSFGEMRRFELGYRFQHISNAGIEEPNDGIDLHLLRFLYRY